MATLDDIVAASEILEQESETKLMAGSNSKPKRIQKDGKIGFGNLGRVSNGDETVVGSSSGAVGKDENAHGFRVGDFVWSKIKSHPWWPGQIHDPKHASDFAVKHTQEGRLLVAFFGDGSCSWCLPSQLIPFVENFEAMCTDGNTKSFHNAVREAVNEISRISESEMTCKCVALENREGLDRPVVKNSGVRAGVLMPEVGIDRLSIPRFEADEILEKVMGFGRGGSFDNMLELGVLKSCLSAFYRSRGGFRLPSFQEPVHIEGLEEKNSRNVVGLVENNKDFSVPIEVPIKSPLGNVELPEVSGDEEIRQRRKQKSVAEIMQETENVPKRVKVEDEVDMEMSISSLKRKKQKVVENENADESEESEEFEMKEESESVFGPRERKKSKYLSPPYTNPIGRLGNLSSFKVECEYAKSISKNDGVVMSHPPVPEVADDDKGSENTAENGNKLSFSASDVDMPVDELLSKVQLAAVDRFYLRKVGSVGEVSAFTSAWKSSTNLQGSNHKIYYRNKKGSRKRKPLPSLLVKILENDQKSPKKVKSEDKLKVGKTSGGKLEGKNQENNIGDEKKTKSNDLKTSKAVKNGGKLKAAKTSSEKLEGKIQENDIGDEKAKSNDQKTPKTVKSERKLKGCKTSHEKLEAKNQENDTGDEKTKSTDQKTPKKAVKSGGKSKAVKINISHEKLEGNSLEKTESSRPGDSRPGDDFISDAKKIGVKVEIMTGVMERYHSKYSDEDKCRLRDEMKNLMERVENASEMVRMMAENTSVKGG